MDGACGIYSIEHFHQWIKEEKIHRKDNFCNVSFCEAKIHTYDIIAQSKSVLLQAST